MKVLKNVLIVGGLLIVIGAGVVAGIVTGIFVPDLVDTARTNNVAQPTDPTSWVLVGLAAAVVGGLLLGLGIGMPRRTANTVRQDTIEELHRQTTADAAAAAATAADTHAAPSVRADEVEVTDKPHVEPQP